MPLGPAASCRWPHACRRRILEVFKPAPAGCRTEDEHRNPGQRHGHDGDDGNGPTRVGKRCAALASMVCQPPRNVLGDVRYSLLKPSSDGYHQETLVRDEASEFDVKV